MRIRTNYFAFNSRKKKSKIFEWQFIRVRDYIEETCNTKIRQTGHDEISFRIVIFAGDGNSFEDLYHVRV